MNYHWERINEDKIVLFQDGTSWGGELLNLPDSATVIFTVAPTRFVPRAIYKASGDMVESTQDFDSLEQAISGVENLARVRGDTIEGDVRRERG